MKICALSSTADGHEPVHRPLRSPNGVCHVCCVTRHACGVRRQRVYRLRWLRGRNRNAKPRARGHGGHGQGACERERQRGLRARFGGHAFGWRRTLQPCVQRDAAVRDYRDVRRHDAAFARLRGRHIQHDARNRTDARLPRRATRCERVQSDREFRQQRAVPAGACEPDHRAECAVGGGHEPAAALCRHAHCAGVFDDAVRGGAGRRRQRSRSACESRRHRRQRHARFSRYFADVSSGCRASDCESVGAFIGAVCKSRITRSVQSSSRV